MTDKVEIVQAEIVDKDDKQNKNNGIIEVKRIYDELAEDAKRIIAWKTPPEFIKDRPGRGGIVFKYVDVGFMELMLNNMYNHRWSFEVVSSEIIDNKRSDGLDGKHIVVLGKLKIINDNGDETCYMQYGSKDVSYKNIVKKDPNDSKKFTNERTNEMVDVADDFKAAASDSLKKCASLTGIAFDMYHPETREALIKMSESNKKDKEEKNKEDKKNGKKGSKWKSGSY